jgi:hypothetical protein
VLLPLLLLLLVRLLGCGSERQPRMRCVLLLFLVLWELQVSSLEGCVTSLLLGRGLPLCLQRDGWCQLQRLRPPLCCQPWQLYLVWVWCHHLVPAGLRFLHRPVPQLLPLLLLWPLPQEVGGCCVAHAASGLRRPPHQ